ncbi:MAG: two-component system response regulator [Amphritea sp.]
MALAQQSSRQRILVVDDTPDNIEVLRGVLHKDYQITVAISGAKALELARSEHRPDMILLDVMMPEMDGYEVCRRLKRDPRTADIPVIFVTSKDEVDSEETGLEIGAVDYITKPIVPRIVQARVKTQLALYDQNRELDRLVKERTEKLHSATLQIIQDLGRAAEYKDNETGMHVMRMSNYARLLGQAAGLNDNAVELLFYAAPMHDIGKIGIPDSILLKPGKLDAQEWQVMKTHCAIGAEIIGDAGGSELLQLAGSVALTHHEKWNGQGYPSGLAGEEIPLVARIVAIADVFDALTSKRPYKQAWSVEDAMNHLKNEAGEHFDPHLVALFLDLRPELLKIKTRYADDS